MKPREFWVTHEGMPHIDGQSQLHHAVDKDPIGFDIHPEQFYHCREVVKINWDKIWREIWDKGLSVDCNAGDIQNIIEKHLLGEE